MKYLLNNIFITLILSKVFIKVNINIFKVKYTII